MTLVDLLLHGAAYLQISVSGGPATTAASLASSALGSVRRASQESASVMVPMATTANTVGAILAAVALGCRLVSVPLPDGRQDPDEYRDTLDGIASSTSATVLLADASVVARLPFRKGRTFVVHEIEAGSSQLTSRDGFELVQSTSGTTGMPSLIVLSSEAIRANVEAVLERLAVERGDSSSSWLPLTHDMGLIGMLFCSVAAAAHVGAVKCNLRTPLSFLRSPARWLKEVSDARTTITALPDFGLRALVDAPRYSHLDLSRLRAVILGSETIRPATIRAAIERFRPIGLAATALCPAYGMAEFGVAVSMAAPGRGCDLVDLDTGNHEIVLSGTPLDGYAVSTVDGGLGELLVRGPSLGRRPEEPLETDKHGRFATGDLGLVEPGGVGVLGRLDDRLVVYGREVWATMAEESVGADIARLGRSAAVVDVAGRFTILVEPSTSTRRKDTAALVEEVRRRVSVATGASPETVAFVPRGSLPLTDSGKLQRARLVQQLAAGELELYVG